MRRAGESQASRNGENRGRGSELMRAAPCVCAIKGTMPDVAMREQKGRKDESAGQLVHVDVFE